MPKSTTLRKSRKDFPLTQRSDGRFQKKVRGRVHYFTGTRQEALDEWLRIKDDLLAGRDPKERCGDLTLRDLFNRFLTAKKNAVDSGELTQRSWNDYKSITDQIRDTLGLTRTVESLTADDFAKLRQRLAQGRSLVTLKNLIGRAKVVFRYAETENLVEKNIVGLRSQSFRKPSRSDLRKENARLRKENGKKIFTPEEIHLLLEKSTPQLRAFILLACNTGMGNTDVANLDPEHIEDGWLDYPRPKTGVERRAKLWRETTDAIVEAGNLPLLTKYGGRWVNSDSSDNALSKAFRKLIDECGIRRKGTNFYSFRRVFETVAGETKDQPAVDRVMGHEGDDMASVYRQGISDERLEAVAACVHDWLFRKPTQPR